MSERIIISDGRLGQHPISAPVAHSEVATRLRWRKNEHSFSLEVWQQSIDERTSQVTGIWIEVPCVMPEQGKDK